MSQYSLWPIEVGRFSIPVTGGKGKAKEEEPTLSYHAVAYVNLAPLLYPGGMYSMSLQHIHVPIRVHVDVYTVPIRVHVDVYTVPVYALYYMDHFITYKIHVHVHVHVCA